MRENYTSTHSKVNTHLHYSSSYIFDMGIKENLQKLMERAEENPYSLASKTGVWEKNVQLCAVSNITSARRPRTRPALKGVEL